MPAAHPAPPFAAPLPGSFHVAYWSVDPPGRVPVVRRSDRRTGFLDRCRALVRDLRAVDGVGPARLLEAVLIPPVAGVPRHDVVLLVRTTTDAADRAVAGALGDRAPDRMLRLRNVRRIGDTEAGVGPRSTLLLNHFAAPDTGTAVGVWEEVAAWFVAVTGVDNSILLQRDDGDDGTFAIVNYVRLPAGPARFLFGQLLRPGFHRLVRPRLAANRMTASPVLYRPA